VRLVVRGQFMFGWEQCLPIFPCEFDQASPDFLVEVRDRDFTHYAWIVVSLPEMAISVCIGNRRIAQSPEKLQGILRIGLWANDDESTRHRMARSVQQAFDAPRATAGRRFIKEHSGVSSF